MVDLLIVGREGGLRRLRVLSWGCGRAVGGGVVGAKGAWSWWCLGLDNAPTCTCTPNSQVRERLGGGSKQRLWGARCHVP